MTDRPRERGGERGRGGAAAPPLRAWLSLYYLATPAFAAVDLAGGVAVRVAGIESPALRMAYYAAACALGVLMRARPRLAPALGMAESAGNLTLLMASVLIPIWSLPETMDAGLAAELPARVANLALSGSVLIAAFYRSQARLRAGR